MSWVDTIAVHRFVVNPLSRQDPRSLGYLSDAHAYGFNQITAIVCSDLFFIRGSLTEEQTSRLADELLHDTVTQCVESSVMREASVSQPPEQGGRIVEIALRPGVTDPTAAQIVRAANLLGISNINAASTGLRFFITGDNLSDEVLGFLTERVFSNPVIHRYAIGEITHLFPEETDIKRLVEKIVLRGKTEDELMQISSSRRAALNLEEMLTIQAYCEQEGRDLTDVEFEMIAQTWSEHCVHKTFKSSVEVEQADTYTDPVYPKKYTHLFNQTIRAATRQISSGWVRSAFKDNAGIIDFDGEHELSFKVETHNHPSAIEPFGGANTGIGGVIRDVIGVSAKPIASTDVLCFGPLTVQLEDLPEGVLHPRRIESGVVGGIQDYGNKMGIPTVNGAIWYDPGYTANPLVFCGSVGLAPVGSHPHNGQAGDHIVVLGGRTGRDGLRGATFSSMTLDAQTGEVSGASVQIGAPIVEKGLVDVLITARDEHLYHAITDCGAGGLSSAVGEMVADNGGDIQLADVPLKYSGLAPWEIWLSEAQERMVIAVPSENLAQIQSICDLYEIEMTDIGVITDTGRTRVKFGDQTVLDLSNQFLHHGLPQRQYRALVQAPIYPVGWSNPETGILSTNGEETLLKLLAHPNIASKEKVIRVYDHEVQGATVTRPLTGVCHDGPSDGCVIKPLAVKGKQAFALATGMNPEYGKQDPYAMAWLAMDEAIRNVVSCGADPARTAILDNFCWGDPNQPETMGTLVQASQACYDGAVYYGTPFISGKDSFNNEYSGSDGHRHAIPATLLISAIGILPDWELALSTDLKQPGDLVYLVGDYSPVFGGSHYNLVFPQHPKLEGVPKCSSINREVYRRLYACVELRQIAACHDISEGGLAVTASEMALGGRLGLSVALDTDDIYRFLFGETAGCFLIEVNPDLQPDFLQTMEGMPCRRVGEVTESAFLRVVNQEHLIMDVPVEKILTAWKGGQ